MFGIKLPDGVCPLLVTEVDDDCLLKWISDQVLEEHFRNEDGFMELIRRIQHFGLDKYGVIHVKVPDSVTIDQRKKLVPLLDKLKLKVSSWANFK